MTNAIDSKSMTKSHTIQVPRELVEEWISQVWHEGTPVQIAASDLHLADESAQWGADQELGAVVHWLITGPYGALLADSAPSLVADLRAAMRPKPPTLADRAMEAAYIELTCPDGRNGSVIIAALERLAELEAENG